MAATIMAGVKPDGVPAPLAAGPLGEIFYASAVAATGSITLGAIVDGDTITLNDSERTLVFEFDDDDNVAGDNIAIIIDELPAITNVNLLQAINSAVLAITAAPSVIDSSIILTHNVAGVVGNVAILKSGAEITVVGMSGGRAAVDLHAMYDVLDGLDVTINASDINIGNVDVVSLPALPAGTNNIGDVDIVSLPAITGSVTATPPVVTLTTVTTTVTTAGDNTIIAAPSAGNRLRIHQMQIQLEETAVQTVLVKSGSTNKWRFVGDSFGNGINEKFEPGKELVCGTAEAFILNLAAAKLVGYVIRYTTEVAS